MNLASLKTNVPARDRLQLLKGRMHEASGAGAVTFALAQAAQAGGQVAWIWPRWEPEVPMPQGLGRLSDRLVHIRPANEMDILWAVEECLRSSAVSTVISKPKKPLTLTQGRRFQLAAAEGETIGIMVIARDAGCPAAETRWECDLVPAPADVSRHRWRLVKDKKGPEATWDITVPPCFEDRPHVQPLQQHAEPAGDAQPLPFARGD